MYRFTYAGPVAFRTPFSLRGRIEDFLKEPGRVKPIPSSGGVSREGLY